MRSNMIRAPSAPSATAIALGGAVDLRGQLGDVVALIAALGRILAARPRPDRRAEQLDLGAGVVEVVLAVDRVAVEAQQARERVAVGGVAAARRGQRAGGVGGDELDVQPLGRLGPAAAPGVAGRQHLGRRVRVPGVGEEEVQEARPGDLDALDRRAEPSAQRVAEALGDRPRRLRRGRAPAASPRWWSSRRSPPCAGARASGARRRRSRRRAPRRRPPPRRRGAARTGSCAASDQ